MAISDLTGQKTSKSFQNLLQISSSGALYDGTGSLVTNLIASSSYAATASYVLNAGASINTSSFVTTSSFNSFTSNYNTGSFTGSFTGTLFGSSSYAANALTASYLEGYISPFPFTGSAGILGTLTVTQGITGSLFGTSSWSLNSISSSFAQSATLAPNYLPLTGGVITGSLTITNNLTVIGSASIQYISESVLNIGTNLITVNTATPAVRFGGLAIIDSGSSPAVSASFLYDSLQDEFIFVHKGTAAGAITSSHFVLGPETYNNLGNETYLTANRIPKGVGNEHLNDSNISDNGSVVSINSNSEITGSLIVTAGITGSLFGTSSWATNAVTASYITSSNVQGPFGADSILSASYALTASFALNAGGGGTGGTDLGLVQAMTLGLQNIF